jgi:uroporphyrin-III C-methyltransferase/precorrin-2 dehydrogenase/sirohydrochlorin ferrochelatase
MLNVIARRVLFVGAGPVALRKAQALVAAGAKVTLVSPEPMDHTAAPEMTHLREPYRPEHLNDTWLVYACTEDASLNARIAADARNARVWVNCVDQPDLCDFFSPAVVTRGDVVAAIGTGGKAPTLAASLKEQLAQLLPENIAEFAEALSEIRQTLLQRNIPMETRRRIMKTLSEPQGYQTFAGSGAAALHEMAEAIEAGNTKP